VPTVPGTVPGEPGFQTATTATAGVPTWAYLLGGAVVLGGGYYLYKRGKKGSAGAGAGGA